MIFITMLTTRAPCRQFSNPLGLHLENNRAFLKNKVLRPAFYRYSTGATSSQLALRDFRYSTLNANMSIRLPLLFMPRVSGLRWKHQRTINKNAQYAGRAGPESPVAVLGPHLASKSAGRHQNCKHLGSWKRIM